MQILPGRHLLLELDEIELAHYWLRSELRTLPLLGLPSSSSRPCREIYVEFRTALNVSLLIRPPASSSSHGRTHQNDVRSNRHLNNEELLDQILDLNNSSSLIDSALDSAARCVDLHMRATDHPDMGGMDTHDKAAFAIVRDYRALAKSGALAEIFDLPLWPTSPERQGRKPLWVEQLENRFADMLVADDLQFVRDDYLDLIDRRPAAGHCVNYLNKWSDVVISNPALLRRAILFGDPAERIHLVRTILLGDGGSGKSSLSDLIQRKDPTIGRKITLGVDHSHHVPIKLNKIYPDIGLPRDKLDLFIWDFGGQSIFHGLHSAFLHENCVYVLVVDSRHEQSPDDWLHQIRHLAGPRAKVLLVTNWYEECEVRQNERRLLREFPDLLRPECFHYFSCAESSPDGLSSFLHALAKAGLKSQRMVLKETLDIKRKLDIHYTNKEKVFLRESELVNIIKSTVARTTDSSSTIDQLQQLGFVVRVADERSSYCLNPTWVVDHAYELAYSARLSELNGVVGLREIENVLGLSASEEDIEKLLDFLAQRSLCVRLRETGKYFFADSSSSNEPRGAQEFFAASPSVKFRFSLPYIPLGFHARLVYELFLPERQCSIRSSEDIWRQGFIVSFKDARMLVHYQSRKSYVEVVFSGKFESYGELLSTFFYAMKNALSGSVYIDSEKIIPFVILSEGMYSVHDSEELVKLLGREEKYEKLIKKVKEMASKEIRYTDNSSNYTDQSRNYGDRADTVFGSNSKITSGGTDSSNNVQLESATSNDEEQLARLIDALLSDSSTLSAQELMAIAKVKSATDGPVGSNESGSLAKKIWGGIREATDFSGEVQSTTEFIMEHKDQIKSVLVDIASRISS